MTVDRCSPCVLVVDDDRGIREYVSLALRDSGYDVVLAADGREALERLAVRLPALVLLDLQMPVMNGWAVLQQVRTAQPYLPVVILSGHIELPDDPHEGFDARLTKPFDLNALIEVVDRFAPRPAQG
jgi:CheY-like chemotaxis protein